MTDPRSIFPLRDEDVPEGTSLFRLDPQNPPVPRMPAKLGPDSIGFRKQRNIEEFWKEWFSGENLSLDDLYPQRLAVAWRLVRELAGARGLFTARAQTLAEVTRVHPTPWIEPFHFFNRMGPDPVVVGICQERKLPLLPPDIPATHVNGRVDEGYDPEQDESLLDFIRLSEHVASRRLFVARTKAGRHGLAGLFDPSIARMAWPSPAEIMHFEQILVEKIYATMVSTDSAGGDLEASAMLRNDYDLQQHEVLQVLAMARAHAAVATGLDDPESYFMMEIAKMQELARKQAAREDYRGAAQTRRDALRLLANRGAKDEDEDYDGIVAEEMYRQKKKLPKPADDMIGDETLP